MLRLSRNAAGLPAIRAARFPTQPVAKPMRRVAWLAVLAASVTLLRAQGTPHEAVRSLRMEPEGIRLSSPGASQTFLVLASDADGRVIDVTSSCRIASSQPEIVAVDESRGLLVGKAAGAADIRAVLGSRQVVSRVTVGNQSAEVAVRFVPDVISILTTKGCNGSACHGSPAGQNGFKLSLFGYDSGGDYRMIVKAHDGRRINSQNPEQSLLLTKPTFKIPHGGGQVIPPDSEEYRTLSTWVRQGAREDSGGVRLQKLELHPGRRILVGAGSRQRFVVIGRLSDGTTRDMTHEVRYLAADDAVVKVAAGEATASSPGLTTVIARAMGQVATAQVGVIVAPAGRAHPALEGSNFIDELVFTLARRMNVGPRPLSSDREFVRLTWNR